MAAIPWLRRRSWTAHTSNATTLCLVKEKSSSGVKYLNLANLADSLMPDAGTGHPCRIVYRAPTVDPAARLDRTTASIDLNKSGRRSNLQATPSISIRI